MNFGVDGCDARRESGLSLDVMMAVVLVWIWMKM